MTKRNGNISPLTFIDKVIKKNELGQPFGLFSLREILSLALVRWSGQVTPRKINAAVALSFAILAAVRNRRPFDTEEAVKELLGAGDRREIYRLGEVVARTPLYIAHFVTTLTWFQLYGNFAGKLANVITKVQVPIPYAIRSKVRLDHPESIYAPGA